MESNKKMNKSNYQEEPLIRKNINFYNDQEILRIQQNCIKMGFDLNMVNKIIFYFNIRRENEIIDYLIKDENGFWNHPFIPLLPKDNNQNNNNNIIQNNSILTNNRIMNNVLSRVNSINPIKDNIIPKNEELCEICGEGKHFHRITNFTFNDNDNLNMENNNINYNNINSDDSENNNIIINTNNENEIKNEKQKEEENENKCPICLDEFENPIEIENCKHKFCQECFNNYLTNLININNIDNIPCPYKKCDNKNISEEFFSQYITNQTYFKYRQFKAQNEIARDPKKFFCPHCDSYALIEDDIDKYNINNSIYVKKTLKRKNGHAFCSCGRSLHEGDCYKEDQTFKDLLIKENIKQCPKCGFLIKKNKGCNHITCGNPICKYEFCWICMKESIPDHFKYGPCAGLQFIDPDSIIFTIKKQYPRIYCIYSLFSCLYKLFILILALFIFPCISFIYITYLVMFARNRITNTEFIKVIYFFTLSCIFIFTQSIVYMFWITIFSIIAIRILRCILDCFCNKVSGGQYNRENEVELGNINDNNV